MTWTKIPSSVEEDIIFYDYNCLLLISSENRKNFIIQYFNQNKTETFSVFDSEILYGLYHQYFKKLISYHFNGFLILQEIDLALPLASQNLTQNGKKAINIGLGFELSSIRLDCYSIILTKFFKNVFSKSYEVCAIFDFRNFEDYDMFVKPSRMKVCGKTIVGSIICYEINDGLCMFYEFKKDLVLSIK
jgi:hypothetical protein